MQSTDQTTAMASPKLYTPTRPVNIYWQSIAFVTMVLLAFSGWISGGDVSTIEIGARAYIEIALIAFALGGIVVLWGPQVIFRGLQTPVFWALLLFIGWAILSSLWSVSLFLTAGKSIELLMCVLVAAAVAYQVKAAQVPVVKVIQYAVLMVVGILFIVNLIHYHELFPFRLTQGRTRFTLGFDHPNLTAIYFLTIILCGVHQIVNAKRKRTILLQFLIAVPSLVLLVLTDSRTTLVGLIIGVAVILFFCLRQTQTKLVFFLLLLVAGFVVLMVVFSGSLDQLAKVVLIDNPDLLTLNGRIPLWTTVLESVSETSVVGTGYFTSRLLVLGDFKWGAHAHNTYIEIFVTTGVVGFLLFVLFYAASLFSLSKIQQFSLPMAYLLVMTAQGLTEVRLFAPSLTMVVTVLLLVYQQVQLPDPQEERR